ncbi:MAG: hypothetical protein JWO54_315 [Candidatus Saccharibacteria bacterium]|nr:hypothetical protein [Candidatus Saccharibacteria bacterium]MDB5180557.1 hypothetical protein [Candidatus Saccharibacteria bacterium]
MKYISIKKTNGYYHVQVGVSGSNRFLKTNNERAFINVQLQQLLAARSVLEDPLYAKSLAHHIDLLAFSISQDGIQLLAYCIDISSLQYLVSILLERLSQYSSEYQRLPQQLPVEPSIVIRKLAGEHEALTLSADIHLLHQDWEYDRYSSIGFYLHDRRGDWMKLWRLTKLYNNDPATYRNFVEQKTLLKYQSMPTEIMNFTLSES